MCVCVCVCVHVCACAKSLQSCLIFATLWTLAHQAPLSMGFSRQETSVGCCAYLPDPEIEPTSLVPPALAGRFFTTSVAQRRLMREIETGTEKPSLWKGDILVCVALLLPRLLGVLLFSLAVHPLWRHVVICFAGLSASSEITPSHQPQDPLPVMMQAPFSPSLLRCVTHSKEDISFHSKTLKCSTDH